MPHSHLYQQFIQNGQIKPITPTQQCLRINEELKQLQRLKQQPSNYLNEYDQLFRLVSLLLLDHGYDLTNHQPHQLLKQVCHSHCPNTAIEKMIQHRHDIKKGWVTGTCAESLMVLQYCSNRLFKVLQVYKIFKNIMV